MTKLDWGLTQPTYLHGVDKVALYFKDHNIQVPWRGVTEISSQASYAHSKEIYINGRRIESRARIVDSTITLASYSTTDYHHLICGEAEVRSGFSIMNQFPSPFDMTYRRYVDGEENYRLYAVYNCHMLPGQNPHKTNTKTLSVTPTNWRIFSSGATLSIGIHVPYLYADSRYFPKDKLEQLENLLYGRDNENPRMPSPDDFNNMVNDGIYDPIKEPL